jgi:hypothetical protein
MGAVGGTIAALTFGADHPECTQHVTVDALTRTALALDLTD